MCFNLVSPNYTDRGKNGPISQEEGGEEKEEQATAHGLFWQPASLLATTVAAYQLLHWLLTSADSLQQWQVFAHHLRGWPSQAIDSLGLSLVA